MKTRVHAKVDMGLGCEEVIGWGCMVNVQCRLIRLGFAHFGFLESRDGEGGIVENMKLSALFIITYYAIAHFCGNVQDDCMCSDTCFSDLI